MNINDLKEGGIVAIRDVLLDKQADGEEVCRLESGDPSFDIPNETKLEMIHALVQNKTHYTSGAGIKELREVCYEKVTVHNRLRISGPEKTLVTVGAMNGLFCTFAAAFKPGDRVLVPTPTWTETVTNLELLGIEPVYYPMDPFDKKWDHTMVSALQKKMPTCQGIVINFPHNPTGLVAPWQLLVAIEQLASTYNCLVISDEAYEDVYYGNTPESIGCLNSHNVVSIYSMSKSYAMSGLRVGYLACDNEELIKDISKWIRCTVNGVNSVSQWGAVAALEGDTADYKQDMRYWYHERRNLLVDALKGSETLEPSNPDGTFYIWCKIKNGMDDWEMTMKLLEKNVGSTPGSCFGPGGKGHIRFAFSCPTEHIERAVKILKDF